MTIKEYGVASSCSSNCGGGAILVNASKTGLIINDVIFEGNVTDGASGDGGVVEFLSSSTGTFNSCIFKENRAGASNAAESGKMVVLQKLTDLIMSIFIIVCFMKMWQKALEVFMGLGITEVLQLS